MAGDLIESLVETPSADRADLPLFLKSPIPSQEEAAHIHSGRKERRQPSVTPRKFNRFFTPRSHGTLREIPSRCPLEDITAPANNRNGIKSSPVQRFSCGTFQDNSPTAFTRELKRRKLFHSHSPSPEDADSAKELGSAVGETCVVADDNAEQFSYIGSSPPPADLEDKISGANLQVYDVPDTPRRQIKQLDARGLSGQLTQLSLGSGPSYKRMHLTYPVSDWQNHTAEFHSLPEDTHHCTSIENPARCIPFCAASCNTNTLVAVGDEEGHVRLLESAENGKPLFKDVFLAFRPHSNAIIDMSFSPDDSLLATASGDQTARIIDMATQRTTSVLAQHSASLKQVKFQPGAASNSVLATSSRDGSVQIWDLRCKGAQGPVQAIHIPMDPTTLTMTNSRANEMTYGCVVNSIYDAHRPGRRGRSIIPTESFPKAENHGRLGDVSVTAIAFLPERHEHMLLTASEANASIKLWDVRSLHNTRRKAAIPLSCTAQPESHNQWRNFGINSLSMNGNSSRLYALCKDNTVYVYSTAHLLLGQVPELSARPSAARRRVFDTQDGLGPLYGYRHPQLHATSFYVKAEIRPAKAGRVELLAVGSCDGCTILFPTDERYVDTHQAPQPSNPDASPRLRRTESQPSRSNDNIPISENGTPLIRGHDKEVGALAWTSAGDLVTVGDDFLVRCWREGPQARKLRMGGEQGGQRWGCGWANVCSSYDDEEEDEEDEEILEGED